MVFSCCVPLCKNTNKVQKMHMFPKDERIYKLWLKQVQNDKLSLLESVTVRNNYRVCDIHFSESDRIVGRSGANLKIDSVPSLKLLPQTEDQQMTTPEIKELYDETAGSLANFIMKTGQASSSRGNFMIKEEETLTEISEPFRSVVGMDIEVVDNNESTEDMSEETKVIVREAKREDMHQVIQLIRDLAVFEELEDQVKINAETLIKDGFDSDSPAFKCFVAEVEDEIVGYALYYTSYSTWLGKSTFMEDLYVKPSYRNCRIGKELILCVAKVAHETNSKRLDFHVLSWNSASEFYKSLGAVNLTESEKWELYRINEDGLNKLFNQ